MSVPSVSSSATTLDTALLKSGSEESMLCSESQPFLPLPTTAAAVTASRARGDVDDEEGGGSASVTVSTSSVSKIAAKWKWFAFACTMLMGFGSHYEANVLSVLKATLKTELGINNTQYGVLQAAVTLINTVAPVLTGFSIDRFGTRWGSVVSCAWVSLGALLVALSATFHSYHGMFVGRLVYGVGAVTLVTFQHVILNLCFRPPTLALVLGIHLAVSRLASFLSVALTAPMLTWWAWVYPLWTAAALCWLSWLGTWVYALRCTTQGVGNTPVGVRTRRTVAIGRRKRALWSTHGAAAKGDDSDGVRAMQSQHPEEGDAGTEPLPTPAHPLVPTPPPPPPPAPKPAARDGYRPALRADALLAFSSRFWCVAWTSFALGATWTAFLHVAPELLARHTGRTALAAGLEASLGHLVPIAGAPAAGWALSRGWVRPRAVIACAALAQLAAALALWLRATPGWLAMLLVGGSLAAGPVAMLSCVAHDAGGTRTLGLALGVYKAMANIGSSCMDPTLGFLQDTYSSYTPPLLVLAGTAALAALLQAVPRFLPRRGATASGGGAPRKPARCKLIMLALVLVWLFAAWVLCILFYIVEATRKTHAP